MNKKTLFTLLWSLSTFAASAQYLTTPRLVKDIATNQQANSTIAQCAASGNVVICSDGSAVGTSTVYTADDPNAEIQLLDYYTNSYSFLRNLKIYFFTVKTATETQLFRYDFATTELVDSGMNINHLGEKLNFPDRGIYYIKNDRELWTTDIEGNATQVKIFPAPVTRFVGNTSQANIIVNETKLWQSKFTPESTQLLKTFTHIGEIENNLMAANDGGFNGIELWNIIDGATWMLENIAYFTESSNPSNFTRGYGSTFFTVDIGNNSEIWEIDYQNPEPFFKDIPIRGQENRITAMNFYRQSYQRRTLYYATNVGNNTTVLAGLIWIYENGEERFETTIFGEVTGVVTDIQYPYFTVDNNGQKSLWTLNNDQLQYLLNDASVSDIFTSSFSDDRFIVNAGKLYYLNDETSNPLQVLQEFNATAQLSFFPEFAVYVNDERIANQLFAVYENEQSTVWRIENANQNVQPVSNYFYPNATRNSTPNNFGQLNDKLYFTAFDYQKGIQLWKSDLTESGTQIVTDISSSVFTSPNASVYEADDVLYYLVPGSPEVIFKVTENNVEQLIDGSTAFAAIRPSFNTLSTNREYQLNGKTYRVEATSYYICSRCPRGAIGQIVEVLPDTTRLAFSYNYRGYSSGFAPTNLTAFNGKFYFIFNGQNADGSFNNETALWESDGTPTGTRIVQVFEDRPTDFVAFNNALYILADDGVNGRELLRLNTDNSIDVLTNTGVGRSSLEPSELYLYNERLYFVVETADRYELWGSDGSTLGSRVLANLRPVGSSCTGFCTPHYYINGQLAFTKTDPEVGEELFVVDLPDFEVIPDQVNNADLEINQTIQRFLGQNFTRLENTITIQNNGPATAENVEVKIGQTDFYFSFGTSTLSRGEFAFGIWKIAQLAVGESATMTLELTENRPVYTRLNLTSIISSDLLDANSANNTATTSIEPVANCAEIGQNGFQIDYFLGEWTESSPIVFNTNLTPSGSVIQNRGLTGLSNFGDLYTQRARGYITPTTTGNYTFYLSGDDNTDFFLSTNTEPANKSRLAYIDDWTFANEFDKFPYQTSAPVFLQAGQAYYFEVLLSEERGDDHFAVHWTTSTNSERTLVPHEVITPFCAEAVNYSCAQVDTELPVLINCPQDITVYIPAGQPTIAFWTPPTATDNCGIRSIESTYQPGDVLPYNNTSISYTATDSVGNETYCFFVVNRITTSGLSSDNQSPINSSTDKNLSSLRLYPTTTSDILTVEIRSTTSVLKGQMVNGHGQVIQSIEWENYDGFLQQKIEVNRLATGIYYLILDGHVERFVKL